MRLLDVGTAPVQADQVVREARCCGGWSWRLFGVGLLAFAPACAMTERNAEPSAGAGAATDEPADVDSARGGAGTDVVPATIDVPELEPQRFCEPQALFASQQLLEGLAPPGAYTERAWLSPDELFIYFIAVLPSSRSVWQASRAARSSAFGAGGPVPGPILPGFYT